MNNLINIQIAILDLISKSHIIIHNRNHTNFMKQTIKIFLIFIFFVLSKNIFSQDNSKCKIFSIYDEPALQCFDKALNKNNIVYQIVEWKAFAPYYFTRIQKIDNSYRLIRKLAPKPKYNEETEKFHSDVEYIIDRNLTIKEFKEFLTIYKKYDLDIINKIEKDFDCSDGSGVDFYIFEEGKYRFLNNGNCQTINDILNNFTREVNSLFQFDK